MGWFWSDGPLASAQPSAAHGAIVRSLPPGCPMHEQAVDAPSSCRPAAALTSSCPVPHVATADGPAQASVLSKLNPLNYMYHVISQEPAPHQTQPLPTERETSSIPKGSRDGNWEYPSPQQMYNALLRKGYTDTDVTAMESMVAVHNFLNEGAWAEIVEWERRFGRGLRRGWEVSRRGEANSETELRKLEARERAEVGTGQVAAAEDGDPTLLRFQGRPKDMTPRAAMMLMMGRLYPEKFVTEPPFDRHDWYVSRNCDGKQTEVRYVIDYYAGPPEPTGEPVFYLDVRPAATVTGACERLIRWGGDVWWRASGAEVREAKKEQKQ